MFGKDKDKEKEQRSLDMVNMFQDKLENAMRDENIPLTHVTRGGRDYIRELHTEKYGTQPVFNQKNGKWE